MDGLVLVLQGDTDGLVLDNAFDATHVFQGLGEVAVEGDVLVVLLEFLLEELAPEIDLLLSVELALHHVHPYILRLGGFNDAGLLVKGAVILQVDTLAHQKGFVLVTRVMEVSQELLAVGADLLDQFCIFPVARDLLGLARQRTAPVDEGAVVGLHLGRD